MAPSLKEHSQFIAVYSILLVPYYNRIQLPETEHIVTLLAEALNVYHVFLSSPGDMETEREVVRDFFLSFNRTIARIFHLRFEVVDWENCTDVGLENPQDLITRQTLGRFRDSLVLVVGLMGQRFGTPTGRFESGTQAEFEWAAKHREVHGHPEVKWFFRRIDTFATPAGDSRAIRDAMAQWTKVQRFRKHYSGLYREFTDTLEFSQALREDLFRWFSNWITTRRTLVSPSPSYTSDLKTVPDFLDNRLTRTIHIVTALEHMQSGTDYGQQCIRICAAMSSLAIDVDPSSIEAGDKEYCDLIGRERSLIEALFRSGVRLRVLLTWNVHEMLEWQRRTREDVLRRLRQLKLFCSTVLLDDNLIRRARLLHIGIRERNLLILGTSCVFEGRKVSTKAGFEATQLITDTKRVAQEIELFEILMQSAVEAQQPTTSTEDELETNRALVTSLIVRIERDAYVLAQLGGQK